MHKLKPSPVRADKRKIPVLPSDWFNRVRVLENTEPVVYGDRLAPPRPVVQRGRPWPMIFESKLKLWVPLVGLPTTERLDQRSGRFYECTQLYYLPVVQASPLIGSSLVDSQVRHSYPRGSGPSRGGASAFWRG